MAYETKELPKELLKELSNGQNADTIPPKPALDEFIFIGMDYDGCGDRVLGTPLTKRLSGYITSCQQTDLTKVSLIQQELEVQKNRMNQALGDISTSAQTTILYNASQAAKLHTWMSSMQSTVEMDF